MSSGLGRVGWDFVGTVDRNGYRKLSFNFNSSNYFKGLLILRVNTGMPLFMLCKCVKELHDCIIFTIFNGRYLLNLFHANW